MLLGLYASFGAYWSLFHAVTFDGVSKRIIVNAGVSTLSVKRDIYSAWKEWVSQDDNSKYEQALRSIGGDPIGPGLYAGDIYFLLNGWKVYVDHEVAISGVLYTEDASNPFVTPATANVVRSTVSNLVQTATTAGATDLTPVLTKIDQVGDLVIGLS